MPGLVIILELKLFGPNFLPLLYLDLMFCGILSAGLIWAARHVRGKTEYADAFFPALLLHFGHAETFLWAGTLPYVMTTFFVGCFLIVQIVTRWRPGPLGALASGTCLVLLPLLLWWKMRLLLSWPSLWVIDIGSCIARAAVGCTAGGSIIFLAILALMLLAAYLNDHKLATHEMNEDGCRDSRPAAVANSTLEFLTVGFGPAVRPPAYPLSGLIAAGLLLVGIVCLATSLFRRSSAERECALGLSFYLIGCLAILLVAGYSRATLGPAYLFGSRYAIASVPTLLCLYFVWEFCGPAALKAPGRMVLFSLALSTLSLNWWIGLDEFASRSEEHFKSERDVLAGVSIPEIVSRYWNTIYYSEDKLEVCLKDLRDAQLGEYRNLPPDPPLVKVPLALDPVDSHNLEWKGGAGRGTGAQPYVTFDLKDPTYVTGVRIRYSSKQLRREESLVPDELARQPAMNEEFVEQGRAGTATFPPLVIARG